VLLCLCAVAASLAFAQQKPTIGTLDGDVKQAAADQAVAAARATTERENERLRAELAEARQAIATKQAAALAAETERERDARLTEVENALKKSDQEKAAAALAEAQARKEATTESRENWLEIKRAAYSTMAALLGSLIAFAAKWAADKRKLDKMSGGIERIHVLVNNQKTELMRSKLVALKATLVALDALTAVKAYPDVSAQAADVRREIAELELEIHEQVAATVIANAAAGAA
jgi:multidrug efflux pump subunit AcrA (membrane-fusion protein)